MAKVKKARNNHNRNGSAVALQRPKRKKTKPTRKLTTARLKKLAKKHKPPQSWFDNEEEGLY